MPNRYRLSLLLGLSIVCLCLICPAVRADDAAPGVPAPAELADTIQALLRKPALAGGIVGVEIVSLADGSVVYSQNADIRLMPASNRKLFTDASALHLLGPDFRFTTSVVAAQKPDGKGLLRGGLCLRGTGDGALTLADLDQLARSLHDAGIRTIAGDIHGDGSAFIDGPYPAGWGWDYLSDDYAAAIGALEVNDGDFTVLVTAAAKPLAVTCRLDPAVTTVAVTVRAHSYPASNRYFRAQPPLVIRRSWDRDAVTVTGAIPTGGVVKQTFSIVDPALFTAECFRLACVRAGIVVHGCATTTPFSGMILLTSHQSVPLSAYLPLMMKPSDNLIAESLIRAIGVKSSGRGDYDSGWAAEKTYLTSLGITGDICDLADGSGVSRRDFVTAHAVASLLRTMSRTADFGAYFDSLPIAGIDGTLKRRMIGTDAAGNVHAKTGTLTGACALSGYFTGKSGAKYGFSILCNNYAGAADDVRPIEDSIVEYALRTL